MNKNHCMLKGFVLIFSKMMNNIGLGFYILEEGLCMANLMMVVVLGIWDVPSCGSVVSFLVVA